MFGSRFKPGPLPIKPRRLHVLHIYKFFKHKFTNDYTLSNVNIPKINNSAAYKRHLSPDQIHFSF